MFPVFSPIRCATLALFWAGTAAWLGAAETISLADLQQRAVENGRGISSFEIEGTVCSVAGKRVALQDASGTALVECSSLPEDCAEGMRLRLRADRTLVVRGLHAIQFGTAPVVDNDGNHSALTRSGSVYLSEGMQPLHLSWFNGLIEALLEVEYEGPGIPRQKVPASELFHRARSGEKEYDTGLAYETYTGTWAVLPDFQLLKPVSRGFVPVFDAGILPRPNHAGAVFTGFIHIPETGMYTFHVSSDDGSALSVGDARTETEVLPGRGVVANVTWDGSVFPKSGAWVTAEGNITFAARQGRRLVLELAGSGSKVQAFLDDDGSLRPEGLINRPATLRGIGRPDGLTIVKKEDVKVFSGAREPMDLLTSIGEVRRLQPQESRRPYRAKITGVVTTATSASLVLQDSTGGVFIEIPKETNIQPRPGELWEIEGTTDPGDFSPMLFVQRGSYLGRGPMPDPVRPSWDQIASGSLDAEYVEIEGVVSAATEKSLEILTSGGTLKIMDTRFHPLPMRDMDEAGWMAMRGSVISIRGVFQASWDSSTGRVTAGLCYLGNAAMTVQAQAPEDPFEVAPMRAADLLLFTSHSSRFKAVKVGGTALHVRPPEIYLMDGGKGFRVVTQDTAGISPGDSVEAAGYPRLGGPSPVLLEARVRKIGKNAVPEPVEVDGAGLPNAALDATRVAFEASVLSDSQREQERVLELNAGSQRFVARVSMPNPGVKPIQRGSIVRVAGVYVASLPDRAAAEPFEILLQNPADIVILHSGPWWTGRHTMIAVGTLSGGLLIAIGWVVSLRRTVALRSLQLATEIEERQASERHREMESERARVAQDLHDELGSGLTEAGILTSLVQSAAIPQDKKDGYLSQLGEVCRNLVTGLDEIVWAVNPRYDSATDLAGYFSLFAQRFLDLAGIQCRVRIGESLAGHPLDSRQRHGLFLAFKEALNNIVRHSGATEVRLEIAFTEGSLGIDLADNGGGIAGAQDLPGSDGLAGMRSRMENLGGSCRIESATGCGTAVRLSLPLEGMTS